MRPVEESKKVPLIPQTFLHSVKVTTKAIKGTDNQGKSTLNQYSIINLLGQGSYGKVKLCIMNDTEEYYALKIFKKSLLKKKREFVSGAAGLNVKTAYDDVKREITILKTLDHPNIIKLHEVIDDPEEDNLYLVMDYASMGQIMDWDPETKSFTPVGADAGQTFSELEIQKIMRDCVRGMDYLHSNGVLHRDIKPQNILIDERGIAKLADFGVASIFADSDIVRKTVGTYHFFAPECCDPNSTGFSGKAVDIWAMGITLFALIYGKLPFWADSLAEMFEQVLKCEITLSKSRNISKGLKHLLLQIFQKDPKMRITLEGLKQHPWLNEGYKVQIGEREETHDTIKEEEPTAQNPPIHSVVMIKQMVKKWKASRPKTNKDSIDSMELVPCEREMLTNLTPNKSKPTASPPQKRHEHQSEFPPIEELVLQKLEEDEEEKKYDI